MKKLVTVTLSALAFLLPSSLAVTAQSGGPSNQPYDCARKSYVENRTDTGRTLKGVTVNGDQPVFNDERYRDATAQYRIYWDCANGRVAQYADNANSALLFIPLRSQ